MLVDDVGHEGAGIAVGTEPCPGLVPDQIPLGHQAVSGRARGVFQGKILVRREAQKTDGYQMNQALLLSQPMM